ncbi:MAG: ATPase [Bacteroidales bacterium]|nr:ATPase [Bacteroidales bacterium]
MKIIADCGATKSEWRILHLDGTADRLVTGGMNASTMSADAIAAIIAETGKRISATDSSAAEIYLYMAGIPSDELSGRVKDLFSVHIPVSKIEINTDLTGAARAVCGHGPGIAAILGTGSNSCQYDGEKIVKRVYSSGFILGDEGSAATLGKLFIADFLKGLVPEAISSEFSSRYPSDYGTIISNIYRSEDSPSGYLGGFAPFILEHYDHPYIKKLVDGNFRAFIRRSLKQYDTDTYEVGVVGGFGHALQDIFGHIASEEGIRISCFMKDPVDGLVEYHRLSHP